MTYFEALFTLICAQHTSQSLMSCETESLKSGIQTVSIFIVPCIVHVTSQTFCQMLVNFSGVIFQRTVSRFTKRIRKSFSRVYVLHKM